MELLSRRLKQLITVSLFSTVSCYSLADTTAIQKKLESEGYKFIQPIDAPAGMKGWAGHMDKNPSTVFISNDGKYYIVGDLFDRDGNNLTVNALEKHVKNAVLDEVWEDLEKSTWIQDGKTSAPKTVYVFSDPNCPYCHAFWQQARPWVNSRKVQLKHIMVGVIRPESKGQSATLLNTADAAEYFKKFNEANGKLKIKEMKPVPAKLSEQLDANTAMMDKYGFFATPAIIWKDSQGVFKSQQGMPKNIKEIMEQ